MGYAFTVTTAGNNITVNPRQGGNITIAQTGTQVSINTNATLVQTATLADTYKGAWVSGTDYRKGDTVKYNGVVYLAILSVSNSTTNPNNDTTHWTLFSSSTAPTTYSTLTVTQSFTAAPNSTIEFPHPTASTAKISVPTAGDLSGVLVFTATNIRLVTPGAYGGTYVDGYLETRNGIYIDGNYTGGGDPIPGNGSQPYTHGDIFVETGGLCLQYGDAIIQRGRVQLGNDLYLSHTESPHIGYITGTNVTILAGNQITLNENQEGQTKVYGVLHVNNGFTVNAAGETTTAKITFPDNTTMTTAPTGGATIVNYTGITGTGQQQLDALDITAYDTAKYFIRVKDGSNYHITEIVIFYDGTNIGFSQYGIITNNGTLGTFSADKNGSNVRLLFTPGGATSMSIRVARQLMAV
jgi:hypothetical protein